MIDMAGPLTGWARSILGDGVATGFGEFPQGPCAAMVRAAPGDPVVRRYGSGGGVYRFSYELYLRVPARTEGQRLDGLAALQAVHEAVKARSMPDAAVDMWCGHECAAQPSLYAAGEDGSQTYQMTGYLTWIERS